MRPKIEERLPAAKQEKKTTRIDEMRRRKEFIEKGKETYHAMRETESDPRNV